MKLFMERQDVDYNIHLRQKNIINKTLNFPLFAAIQNVNNDSINLLASDKRFVVTIEDVEYIIGYFTNNLEDDSRELAIKRFPELSKLIENKNE